MRYSTFVVGGNKTFTALKVPRRRQLVLLVKVAENKVKRWEVKKVAVGEGLLGLCSGGEELSGWTGQHRDEPLLAVSLLISIAYTLSNNILLINTFPGVM